MENTLAVFAFDFQENTIRITPDGQFSVYDVLVAFDVTDKAHASELLKRISDKYPEVHAKTVNFKFPGRGQRETPVATEEAMYQILMLCPGQRGAEFREIAAKALKQFREETSNPELGYTRARARLVTKLRSQGKTEKEIAQRIKAIETRNHFTDALNRHGVTEGWQYAKITNALYYELLGGDAATVRKERGLPVKGNVRDSMSYVELTAVDLIEALAAQKMDKDDINGFVPCKDVTQAFAKKIKDVIDEV